MGSTTDLPVDDVLADLAVLSDALRETIEEPSKPQNEYEVWKVYAGSERAVAKLKYRMGVERPGVFTELPRSKRPDDCLREALEDLTKAQEKMHAGTLAEALEALREARTFLRAYLSELRRVRSREKRRAALSPHSSSPSS